MEELTKSQLVLLVLLVSFVTAVATAAIVVSLSLGFSPVRTIERVITNDSPSIKEGQLLIEPEPAVSTDEQVAKIVQEYAPAVVSIVASKDVPLLTQCYINPFGANDPMRELFPNLRIPQVCQKGTEKREVGAGSGFFVDSSGLIATNKHVVSDTDASYDVVLSSGKTLSATVVARDAVHDLALLRVEAGKYPSLVLGDSDKLAVGRTVIAIGNALGEFSNSVSVGIISGLSRTITAQDGARSEELRSLIQTDAAINPGNSGGPLISLDGKVIGINTAVASGAENIGFALPINILKKDIQDVLKSGKISRAYLGVRYAVVTPAIASAHNLSSAGGVILRAGSDGSAVEAQSPAAQAGLREGDVLMQVDGKAIRDQYTLSDVIANKRAGDVITLTLVRDGATQNVKITLGEYSR